MNSNPKSQSILLKFNPHYFNTYSNSNASNPPIVLQVTICALFSAATSVISAFLSILETNETVAPVQKHCNTVDAERRKEGEKKQRIKD